MQDCKTLNAKVQVVAWLSTSQLVSAFLELWMSVDPLPFPLVLQIPSVWEIPLLKKLFFLASPTSFPTLLHVCVTDRLHRERRQRLICSSLRWGAPVRVWFLLHLTQNVNPWVLTCAPSGCHCEVMWLEQWVTSYTFCFPWGLREDEHYISWLNGYLIWSFVDYFVCQIWN